MRKNLLWAFIVVLTALIQTTWLDAVRVAGVLPNLPLVLVVYFAVAQGQERAMFTGVLGGLFQDVSGNLTLGHNVLCYVIIGYIVGRLSTRLVTEHPVVKAGLVFLAALAFGALDTVIKYVQEPQIAAFQNVLSRVVPTAFYTALATPILYILLTRLFRERVSLQGEEA